jgi:hypothetical protein
MDNVLSRDVVEQGAAYSWILASATNEAVQE